MNRPRRATLVASLAICATAAAVYAAASSTSATTTAVAGVHKVAPAAAWTSASVRPNNMPSVLTVPNEKNPTVPSVSLTMTAAPYNDHSWQIIGLKKGWYKSVGIGLKIKPSDMPQEAPALLSGTADVATVCASCWIPALDQTTDNKMFTFSDTFVGQTILAKPNGHYKTLADLEARHVPYAKAIKRVMAQVKGKTFFYSTNTSGVPFRTYVLKKAGLGYSDFKGGSLDDVKLIELATAGRTDFVQTGGGPPTVRLLTAGWKPLVTGKDVADSGDRAALSGSDFFSGMAARKDWLSSNHATALRMASVMFRTIDFKVHHEKAAAAIQMPYLNSLAGASFGQKDAFFLDHVIDPFWTFDQQKKFFVPNSSIYYYKLSLQALIDSYEKSGVLKKQHVPDDFVVAASVWRELDSLRRHSDQLFKSVGAKLKSAQGPNATKAKAYLRKAQSFYAARDYLDSFRFANAARLWVG